MRFQFGTPALLLATAFVAICIGATLPFWRGLQPVDLQYLPKVLGVLSPTIVPFLFVAYALGRKALTAKIVLAFPVAEAAAVVLFLNIVGR